MNPRLRKRFDEAVKLERSGQLNVAKEILQELARLDSGSPAIFSVLGHVCWQIGLLDEAAAAFQKATELAPKLEAASLGLFHMLLKIGKEEQALEEAERFLLIADSQNYQKIIDENYKRLVQAGSANNTLGKKRRKRKRASSKRKRVTH